MLTAIIRFALHNRLLVLAAALLAVGYGTWQALQLADRRVSRSQSAARGRDDRGARDGARKRSRR